MPMAPARSSGIDTKHSLLSSPILDLKFNLACQRPDSPTSLEDSQSESGDSLDNSDSSATSESETNTDSKDKNATMHVERDLVSSLSQVATPPLSPARPQFDQETATQVQLSKDHDIQDLRLNEQTPYNSMANTSRSTLGTHGTISSQPRSCLSFTAIPIALEAATAQMPSTPVSAWKSLLPGVAPAPAPAPPTALVAKTGRPSRSTNNNYKSHDLRLNEILPIVLSPEREAKLSMEMIDLFEVRYTFLQFTHSKHAL